MPARIEQLVLPGPELEAIPIRDREAPIVLRVVETYPHGSGFRYDLIYHGLEPGEYDLRDSLRRKDGSSKVDLPPIPVTIRAILPPGQIEPHALEIGRAPRLGGYRDWLWAGAVTWVIGLLAILLFGRHRRASRGPEVARPLSLADRLRPLVESAVAGTLVEGQHAELERLLIGYWRRRLSLEEIDPVHALAILRDHEEAGPLLRALEDWLHRPGVPEQVDVGALLAPYRDLPADLLERGPAPTGHAS